MSSLARRLWAFLDRVGWIIAIVFVAIALWKIHNDESSHNREAEHTRAVQRAGEPTGVCLREAMKAGLPILVSFAADLEKSLPRTPSAERPMVELFVTLTRKAEAPLSEYVRLQAKRYVGVVCPVPKH